MKSQAVGKSKKKAQRRKYLKENELNSNPFILQDISINNFISLFQQEMTGQVTDLYSNTVGRALKLLQEISGKGNLGDITLYDIDKFKSTLLKNRKESTVRNYVDCIKAALKKAVGWGVLKAWDAAEVSTIKPAEKTRRILSDEDEKKLLRSTRDLIGKCIICCALDAGLRAKEISFLDIYRNYDPEKGTVFVCNRPGEVTTKNKKERSVYIDYDHRSYMNALQIRCRNKKIRYPFGKNPNALSKRFSRIAKKAGVMITLHELRGTCATRMALCGTPIEMTARYLGHSDVNLTYKYYVSINEEELRKAREKIQNLNPPHAELMKNSGAKSEDRP